VFRGILPRMILFELSKVFSVALVTLAGLILLAGVISEAMRNGMGPMQILAAVPLLLPTMLPYIVPTATLFATCIVYGRLAADNEIVALKAAGVHILHVIWPAILLGLAGSAVTMWLSLDIIPCTHCLIKSQAAADVEEVMYTMLRRDGFLRHQKINYEIRAKSLRGRTLCDAQFLRRARDGKTFDTVICAREAELMVDLVHQQMLVDMRLCQVIQGNGTVGFMQSRLWAIELPSELNGKFTKARSTDMTWDELSVFQEQWVQKRQSLSQDIDRHLFAIHLGQAPPHFPEYVREKCIERKNLDNQIFMLECEYHMRPTLALGCLCFALLGGPVGIWFSKSDYLSAFVTCFLPIVTVYYPVLFCMINVSRISKLPPWLGMYNANLLLLVVGLVLFRRLQKT
jgi:lipopolysaccharide export system permease protein